MSEFHGVTVGSAITVAPAAASLLAVARESLDLEGDADVPGHALPHLHLVDEGRVRRVGDLERGVAGLEDRDAAARRAEGGALAQPEHVPVEMQRLVVIGRRHDEPKLAYILGFSGSGHDACNA